MLIPSERLIGLMSATEARYAAREKDRAEVHAAPFKTKLTEVETPKRIALRAARLGVAPARATELMEPGAISLDPAELGFERVLGRQDFVRMDYLERGARAARSVGRVVIRNANGAIVGFGTGFLVAPRILMTNNHVLGSQEEAANSLIEFNFQRKLDGTLERTVSFPLRPQEFFFTDAALDVTVIAVGETSGEESLSQFGFLPLLGAEGKVAKTEAVNIIQHPNGEEKQLALRENEVIDLLETFIHYRTDTSPGSSGSPVLNDQWEVVALHHSGVPVRDSSGRIIAVNDQLWSPEMGETRVKWKANEGVRISRIAAFLRTAKLTPEQRNLLKLESAAVSVPPMPPSGITVGPGIVSRVEDGQLTMSIPLTIAVSLGIGGIGKAPAKPDVPIVDLIQPQSVGIDAAVEEVRRILRDVPEVIEVRKGWKFRNGWITDERSVVVVVNEKLSETELRESGREPLPQSVGGFSIDVRPATPLLHLGLGGGLFAERFALEAFRKPKIRYKGPPNAAALLAPFRERMRLIAHASPDAGFPQLASFINRTASDFRVAMFDFGAPHIVSALSKQLKPSGRRMQITIQPGESLGGGSKANDLTDEQSLEALRKAMGKRLKSALIRPSSSGGYVASSYHIKVAVRDSEEAWLSSGNWQSSNQPDQPSKTEAQKRALLNGFNREWHVIAKGPKIARTLKTFLDHDFKNGPEPETMESVAFPMVELIVPPDALEAAKAVKLFPALEIDDEVDVQVALTPDNYAKVALALIESATEKVFFENQSFSILNENDDQFQALLSALLAKQRAGLDVRIIFRDIGDVATALERAKDFGFDMKKIRVHRHCHTKGIVVDRREVMVGSHNWTNSGAVFNRDASLRILNTKVAGYFEDLFLFDWENMSRQKSVFEEVTARLVGPEAAKTAKGQVVSLAEYLGEE